MAPQTSIWKKEIRLRRRPAPAALQVVPEAAPEPAAPADGTSWWKKEVSLAPVRLGRPGLPVRSPRVAKPGREATRIVGLRIGSSQLAAALVDNGGSAELLRVARTPLERGIVAGGEVRDAGALADALKRFFRQQRLPRRGVRLGVATNRIGVRVLEVPAIDDERQLANAVRFRAQDVVPIPITDAVLDHVVLGEADTPGERTLRVLIVFAHRELVDGYVEACKQAGIGLAGIDFDAFALLRALRGDPAAEPAAAALVAVAIGHERTIFAVSEGAVCDFARVLDWGGAALDAAIARALDVDLAEAEAIKRKLSLATEASSVAAEAARTAVRQELQVLARELLSSLQFYQSRPGSLAIGEVLLAGGAAQLEGLDAELRRQLGVPVRLGDPFGRVELGKGVEPPADPSSLAIAVGLALEV